MSWFEKDHFGHLRGPSDRLASLFDWATPNLVTLAGAVLVLPMVWAFMSGHVILGLFLFLVGIFTDVLDGPLARYQEANLSDIERRNRDAQPLLLRRGQTSEGSAFDPIVDKLRFFGAAFPLGWVVLWRGPLLVALAAAVIITIARFFVKGAKANKIGKLKALAEAVLIALLVPIALGVPQLTLPANIVLLIATLGGILSLAGQAFTWLKRKNASS